MTTPIKVTYTGDIYAGKHFAKQAHVQVGMLKDDMAHLGLKQGRRFIHVSPGITIEARSVFGLDEARVHVTPLAGEQFRREITKEQILEWYWYAVCVSIYPIDPETRIILPINGGEGGSALDVDQYGNVWVAGYSNTKYDFADPLDELSNEAVLIKYDNDGKYLGRRVLVGGAASEVNANEGATGVAIDRTIDPLLPLHGGIYITANTYQDRVRPNLDTSLVKYAGDGTIKWQRRLTFAETENKILLSWGTVSDSTGNAIVFGGINFYDTASPYSYLYHEGYLASFAYDGELNWKLQIGDDLRDENGDPTVTNYAWIKTADVDASNNIFIGGNHMDQVVGAVYPVGLIAKFTTAGELTWKRAIEGIFRQANGLYGLYGNGIDIESCATDVDGNVYCISRTMISLGTDTGYFHYHITQVLADGTLGWQRFIETQYYSDSSAAISRIQIAVDMTGVYAVFPQHPNTIPEIDVPWGSYIIKLHRLDSVDPLQPQGGDVAWQRLLTLDLPQPQFTSYSGVLTYDLALMGGDIYLTGLVMTGASPITMKLPSNIPIGYHRGLVFTNPLLTVYADAENIPVREDPGTGEGDPGYVFTLVTDFTLNIITAPFSISTPTTGDYTSPLWTQTNKIIKTTINTSA